MNENAETEKVISYLRSRADVTAPSGLLGAAITDYRNVSLPRRLGFAGLAATAAVALTIVLLLVLGGGVPLGPVRTAAPLPAPASPSASPTTSAPVGPFPSQVDGIQVLSVARTSDLLRSGKLNGRVAAVAGYFGQGFMSCPWPGREMGPLEDWCRLVAFTDDEANARLCTYGNNTTSCSGPSALSLDPFFMTETSGMQSTQLFSGGDPIPLVVVGHSDDPRQWQCRSDKQAGCAAAFVVDRIAWASGKELPVTAPGTGSFLSGNPLTARMSLEQVTEAVGAGSDVLTAAAFPAADVASVDPRFNYGGNEIIWIVRSLQPTVDAGDPTRGVNVTLVSDASGAVTGTADLAMAADYQPARLWIQAVGAFECCPDDQPFPFYTLTTHGGEILRSGMINGGSSGGIQGTTTFGPGLPVVLNAGAYDVTAWFSAMSRAAGDFLPTGAPIGTCSTSVTLNRRDDVHLQAAFPTSGPCTWGPAPAETPFP